MRWCRVARTVTASGQPSRTDFQVLATRDVDFSADASPSMTGPAVPSELTRHAPLAGCCCSQLPSFIYLLETHLNVPVGPRTCSSPCKLASPLEPPWSPRFLHVVTKVFAFILYVCEGLSLVEGMPHAGSTHAAFLRAHGGLGPSPAGQLISAAPLARALRAGSLRAPQEREPD